MTIKDVIKIIKTAPAAEFATVHTNGFPEIRALLNLANEKSYPALKDMAVKTAGETITLYFTTNTSSRKAAQLRKNPKACIYFCLPTQFKGVSAIGTIEEVTDPQIKEDFWQKEWRMYYHKGKTDPDYTLLRFTSKHLHCWSGFGIHDFGETLDEED